MPNIISVSRRSDIPAFKSSWFFSCIKAGTCEYKVSSRGLPQTISLLKEDVDCFVFWSKNYIPFIKHLEELEAHGSPFYFHYTINNYPKPYEPCVPDVEKSVETFKFLSKRYGKDRIIWRYDPIFFTKEIKAKQHKDNYDMLFEELSDYTEHCYVSILDPYDKIKNKQVVKEKFVFEEIYYDDGHITKEAKDLVQSMFDKCKDKGITLRTCCELELQKMGLTKGRCINLDLIRKIANNEMIYHPPGPTRPGCGCAKVVDIGEYQSCFAKCCYCYGS